MALYCVVTFRLVSFAVVFCFFFSCLVQPIAVNVVDESKFRYMLSDNCFYSILSMKYSSVAG